MQRPPSLKYWRTKSKGQGLEKWLDTVIDLKLLETLTTPGLTPTHGAPTRAPQSPGLMSPSIGLGTMTWASPTCRRRM
eukprot:13561329-Heterocapsa_arctica.AAC.1